MALWTAQDETDKHYLQADGASYRDLCIPGSTCSGVTLGCRLVEGKWEKEESFADEEEF